MKNQSRFVTLAVVASGLATIGIPVELRADVVHADDVIITGNLCAGSSDCVDGRTFLGDLEVTGNPPEIIFFDISSGADDWEIEVNADDLSFKNHVDGGSIVSVVKLNGGAPANSLTVDSDGDVGFGTAVPGKELHAVAGDSPTLRLDQDGTAGFTPQVWDIFGNDQEFALRDVTHGSARPFRVEANSPANSLYIEDTGQVGVGTGNPLLDAGNGIHIYAASDEFAFLGAGVAPSAGGNCAFNIGYGGGAAPGMVFITTRPCGGNEMTRFFVGNTERARADTAGFQVFGSLRVNGTGVNVPDYVFRPGFAIESIEEHAESMWRKSHLPALGPAAEDGGFEVAKTTMGMLEELEKAHIYIEQLHEEAKQKDERTAALEEGAAELRRGNADLAARLERLEALIAGKR